MYIYIYIQKPNTHLVPLYTDASSASLPAASIRGSLLAEYGLGGSLSLYLLYSSLSRHLPASSCAVPCSSCSRGSERCHMLYI